MKTSTQPTAQQTKNLPNLNRVRKYSNDAVVERLQKDLKISLAEAYELFQDMLQFLYVAKTSDLKPISPPAMIDEAWHTFIIYTKDYTEFCQEHFGTFIHHRPHRPGERHGNEGGVNCRKAAQQILGNTLSKNWGINTSKCEGCNGQCNKDSCSKSCDSNCREECCI